MVSVEKSKIDQSVNFIEKQLEGFLESRYVRKCDDYFICYLSSQNGCSLGCKFCWLTATHQGANKKFDSDYQDYLMQMLQVLRHYRSECEEKKFPRATKCHINFMARGEILENQNIINEGDKILLALADLIVKEGLIPKFNVSTILPKSFESKNLTDVFRLIQPTIYYSLYSMNPAFRKKWLPMAMDPNRALRILKNYQDSSKKIVKIHYCFIKDENDSLADLDWVCNSIDHNKLLCEFNLVRYNSHGSDVSQGEESDEPTILRNLEYLKTRFKGKVQMIPRVGYDSNVRASCGMFIDKDYKQFDTPKS